MSLSSLKKDKLLQKDRRCNLCFSDRNKTCNERRIINDTVLVSCKISCSDQFFDLQIYYLLVIAYSSPFLSPSLPHWHSLLCPKEPSRVKLGPGGCIPVLPVETLTQQVQAGRAVGAAGQGRKTGGWSMAGSVRQLQSMAGDSSHLSLIKHYSTSLIVLQVSSYILKELENLANLLIHFGARLKDARQENYPSLILH